MLALKPNKAPGPDGVKPSVLKKCAEQLSGIMCEIFNMPLKECKLKLMLWSGVLLGILTSSWRYLVAEGLDLPSVLAIPPQPHAVRLAVIRIALTVLWSLSGL
ncbi:Non-LTR (Long terminal repeat) retrotransposon and domain-containing protein [Elysia marginata]|uniref:Non-LTR (Long terminal repeat) retrotransposon and domain-containing protein n=1 Tax=Elysia marginata TaxID=1093978 RepID=A0AAV4H8D9_9GAST|nr:Non-LTR (Long terminal repeat) retrotransposon and domain-containing protein [Elysia marginata]